MSTENDARLLADIERDERLRDTAPDMLAVLHAILNTCEAIGPYVDDWGREADHSAAFRSIEELCRAAIAKAERK